MSKDLLQAAINILALGITILVFIVAAAFINHMCQLVAEGLFYGY